MGDDEWDLDKIEIELDKINSDITYTFDNWKSSSPTITWGHDSDTYANKSGKLTLDGDDADLVINGTSLSDTLEEIQQRLNILKPNAELEEQWAELKSLGDRYRALEKDLLEKQKIFNSLKS